MGGSEGGGEVVLGGFGLQAGSQVLCSCPARGSVSLGAGVRFLQTGTRKVPVWVGCGGQGCADRGFCRYVEEGRTLRVLLNKLLPSLWDASA